MKLIFSNKKSLFYLKTIRTKFFYNLKKYFGALEEKSPQGFQVLKIFRLI